MRASLLRYRSNDQRGHRAVHTRQLWALESTVQRAVVLRPSRTVRRSRPLHRWRGGLGVASATGIRVGGSLHDRYSVSRVVLEPLGGLRLACHDARPSVAHRPDVRRADRTGLSRAQDHRNPRIMGPRPDRRTPRAARRRANRIKNVAETIT
jgi:hypothetical protein